MPELPEVETVARALSTQIDGRMIRKVTVFSPKLRTPLLPLAEAKLTGLSFGKVRRRGRYLVLPFREKPQCLLIHLGMTGVIRLEPGSVPKRTHEHFFLHLDNGLCFRFEDARRFGTAEVRPVLPDGTVAGLEDLGPEPLSEDFDGGYLYRKSRKIKTAVKVFLMDNAVVTGVGNIYCTEALFAAGIDPRKAAGSLTRQRCGKLTEAIRQILRDAVAKGGSSIRDYRHLDGSEGTFQLTLQVYGKSGGSCPRCGAALKAIPQGGRTTVFCPRCQR